MATDATDAARTAATIQAVRLITRRPGRSGVDLQALANSQLFGEAIQYMARRYRQEVRRQHRARSTTWRLVKFAATVGLGFAAGVAASEKSKAVRDAGATGVLRAQHIHIPERLRTSGQHEGPNGDDRRQRDKETAGTGGPRSA
jgi:hypothetical protein